MQARLEISSLAADVHVSKSTLIKAITGEAIRPSSYARIKTYFYGGVHMTLQSAINAQVINALSDKTRDEEIINAGGIGGRLPSDYSSAYHKAVKIYKKICNSKHKTIELINTTTAWLKARDLKVKIRIKEVRQ